MRIYPVKEKFQWLASVLFHFSGRLKGGIILFIDKTSLYLAANQTGIWQLASLCEKTNQVYVWSKLLVITFTRLIHVYMFLHYKII